MMRLNYIDNTDCLEGMKSIPDGSVDMVLCDLPYGITHNKWDTAIPFEPLWEQYNRVLKPNGVAALFAVQPFASALVMSNPKNFRYEWVWVKTQPKGHLNAKKMPMRAHENILVFYRKKPAYYPQMTHGHKRKIGHRRYKREANGDGCYGAEYRDTRYDSTDRYPTDVQTFSNGDQKNKLHSTQKPVALCEYLIKTYTKPGEIVLDNCMGSGTTAVACIKTGRNYIGFEISAEYCDIARQRVASVQEQMKIGG